MRIINKEYVEEIKNCFNNGISISRRKNIFYNGIENTLRSDVHYALNDDEKKEYAKCFNDPIYFIENYLVFLNRNIKLREYQIEWIKAFLENKKIIYNVSRQTGYTVIMSALYFHNMIFHNKNILNIDSKLDESVSFIEKIKLYYLNLPYFLKPNIISMNRKSIVFTNSKIKTNTRNMIETKDFDFDIYSFSDLQYNINIYEEIFNFSENKDKRIIIHPNKSSKFDIDLCRKSELPEGHPDKNVYKTIKTYWYEVNGRDDKWKQEEIRCLGSKDLFDREYDLYLK